MTRIQIIDLIKSKIHTNRDTIVRNNTIDELADAILALPLEVPGDEEIREQFPFYDEGIDLISNLDCQMGAEWMRSEILKRNTP